jgi:hypothetical protein
MSLMIYWPKNGHQCHQKVLYMQNECCFEESAECDIGYHSSKITVPYPTLYPLYLIIRFSIQEALALCLCTQTHNNLVWILFWRNILPPSSESLLEMQKVNSSATHITCYPNLDHIMFIRHCENLKEKT